MTLVRKPWKPGAFTTFKPKARKPSRRSADPVTPETYDLVVRRSGASCEAPLDVHPGDRCRGLLHVHHRLPVSWGGKPDVANLLHLCESVHSWAHNHPVAAITWGLLVPRREGQRPSDPSRYPVVVADGRRVLLTDAGQYREVT